MISFPDISSPAWPFKESYEDTSISSKFEDGSMQSRTKFTRSRRTWKLKWNNITREEYVTLMDFVVNKAKFAANTFKWVNTDTIDSRYGNLNPEQEEVIVRITKVGDWDNNNTNLWTGELELTEV